MKHILLSIFVFIQLSSFGQMTVSQNGTVTQWVQNVLLGPGITVSNVSYTGDAQAIGTFSTGAQPTNLGFNSGIILSSGKATDAPGPNNSGGKSTNTSGGSDPQLAALINTTASNIKDAAVLEFDFIPVSDTVKFRYVFGSEEYNEFVGSNYNDVFGFFISGLNPYGGFYTNQNIARIPNTSTPVSINNVNNGSNNTGPCNNCAYYAGNVGNTIQYDGLTVVLTAWIKVIPCFTYHIKLAVSDVGDEIYDSGVFLEANSFMSNAVVINQSTSNTIDTSAVEGCNDAILTFRIPQVKSTNTIINFLPIGTATNGVDYTNIGSQVTIPAGQDSVNLIIHPILDFINEPTEYLKLIVNTSSCTYDTVIIYIKDNAPTVAQMPTDTVLCSSGTAHLNASAIGGFTPYSYLWSTGDTVNSISVSPTNTTTYTLTITDICNNDTVGNVQVIVSSPKFEAHGDTICDLDTGHLFIQSLQPLNYLWNSGETSAHIYPVLSSNTNFTVTATDSLGCFRDTTIGLIVNPLPALQTFSDTANCEGDAFLLKAWGADRYLWSTGDTNAQQLIHPAATFNYGVVGWNNAGCKKEKSFELFIIPKPLAQITSSVDTLCRGAVATLTSLPADDYIWSNGMIGQSIEVRPKTDAAYGLIVSNNQMGISCLDTARYKLLVHRCNRLYLATAFTPNGDGINDYFGPVGEFGYLEQYDFYVFDRWGRMIFHSTDPFVNWDGKINGSYAPNGVYTYRVNIVEALMDPYFLQGTFQLLR